MTVHHPEFTKGRKSWPPSIAEQAQAQRKPPLTSAENARRLERMAERQQEQDQDQ